MLESIIKLNHRQKKTAIYLISATIISWALLIPNYGMSGGIILPPLLYGFGLWKSNKNYIRPPGLRTQMGLILPSLFFIIYFWGTGPFYYLGRIVFSSNLSFFGETLFGCFGAFTLVILSVKIIFKYIHIGLFQIFMFLIFPLICVLLVAYFANISIFTTEGYIVRFDLTVLFYQLFMTIIIVSSMKEKAVLRN